LRTRIGNALIKACLISTAVGVIWGLSSFSVPGAEIVVPAAASQAERQYTVVRGDTLWAIANRLDTSVEALKRANNLQGDVIFPNQVLVIPGTGVTVQAAAESRVDEPVDEQVESPVTRTYTVVAGDSLWSIAQRTGVSVSALKRANNIQNDFLAVNQVLVLPDEPAVFAQAPPSRSGDRVQTILDYARTLAGHPYRWAGSAPGGFDCSGFVVHVFGRHGISLPRTSYDQFKVGTPVGRNELQPGDLVFFTTYRSGASHVGIYYGNGQFLHASSARGRVIWTNLNTHQYYDSRFLGGRRVVP